MLVGETPGDREDLAGEPFVGPAGHLLNEMLRDAELVRGDIYLTNAFKHFRFEQRGSKRLHKKPSWREIRACQPWLEAEINVVRPRVVVCMGATAAQSLLGKDFRITAMRGRVIPGERNTVYIATYHPSAILRAPTSDQRAKMRSDFVVDLRSAAECLNNYRTG